MSKKGDDGTGALNKVEPTEAANKVANTIPTMMDKSDDLPSMSKKALSGKAVQATIKAEETGKK